MQNKNIKKAFTLLEMVFVVVLTSILSLGMFKAFEALYIRSAKAKATTELSMQSQITLNQISRLLYDRIPNSVIGFNTTTNSCETIEDGIGTFQVLEWLSLDSEQLLDGNYSGFVDMNASSRPDIHTPNTNALNITNRNLIFAGTLDGGPEEITACNGAYGWHGNDSNLSHGIGSVSANTITLDVTAIDYPPRYIYEKYYLTNGAYAIARGEDIDLTSSCITDLDITVDNNTLFLFYNFYPYNGQTFCADGGSGKVSILAENVTGFRARHENDIIRLSIDMNQTIRGSSDVRISKQKAVF